MQLKSNKELFAFLFNDFLLLTVPPRVLGSSFVASHIFDMKTKDQYRMYRTVSLGTCYCINLLYPCF